MKPKIAPIAQEREFHLHELFFSITDKKGIIQSGNDVFARVSGFSLAELLGQPHNVVRHPDMPSAVFKLLWDYLKANKSIVAYVKNMAADGRYYWVVALATPVNEGYLSVRFKPSSEIFAVVRGLYEHLVTLERNLIISGKTPKVAMAMVAEELTANLNAKGFADYDAFMHFALRTELKSRATLLPNNNEALSRPALVGSSDDSHLRLLQRLTSQSDVIAQNLTYLFSKLDDFVLVGEKLASKVDFISDLAQGMRVLSLNTGIASARMQTNSSVLTSIANLMGENSNHLNENVFRMGEHLLEISAALKEIAYDLAAARLQLEMLQKFLVELQQNKQRHPEDKAQGAVARILTLQETFVRTYRGALTTFQRIESDLFSLTREGTSLNRCVQTLQFVHLVGRVEIARHTELAGFGKILTEVLAKIQNTKDQLDDLAETITYLLGEVDELGQTDKSVSASLRDMNRDTQALGVQA